MTSNASTAASDGSDAVTAASSGDHQTVARLVRSRIREVPDWPTPGIQFKDISPLLADPEAMRLAIDAMAAPFRSARITHVVAVESRGFLFGVPIALALDAAFVPARKAGKLPWRTMREEYTLEYRTDVLEMHADALGPGDRVLVVDDVLATGGTAAAVIRLVERLGGAVAGVSVLLELGFLDGRRTLGGRPVAAVVAY
jgi:adenine phosphoribosyltransferase